MHVVFQDAFLATVVLVFDVVDVRAGKRGTTIVLIDDPEGAASPLLTAKFYRRPLCSPREPIAADMPVVMPV